RSTPFPYTTLFRSVFPLTARHASQIASAATKVVPERTIWIDHASPAASLISGMSTVRASPPIAVRSRPLAWLVSGVATGSTPGRVSGHPLDGVGRGSGRPVALPAFRPEMLLRLEAYLVRHLARAVDPVAEIDMGQAGRARPLDVVEDHVGAERAFGEVRIVEGIDHRQADR